MTLCAKVSSYKSDLSCKSVFVQKYLCAKVSFRDYFTLLENVSLCIFDPLYIDARKHARAKIFDNDDKFYCFKFNCTNVKSP